MTATQKQVKRALYNGLPNLSDRELRQMIDRELEKDNSQIDMNYIDTCFDLMEMHADGRIARTAPSQVAESCDCSSPDCRRHRICHERFRPSVQL